MNENNYNEEKKSYQTGGSSQATEPVKARDIWHNKVYGSANDAGSFVNGGKVSGGKRFNIRNRKAIIIFACIFGGLVILAGFARLAGLDYSAGYYESGDISGAAHVSGEHIGVLFVEGTIAADDETYDHAYALDAIDGMMENDDNRGLMLYVNTPGGGVYESDELYLKIKEYQDTTGRPVYSYMASQATSGGYYISAPADKIIANRNCWTGSIGVTIGTLFDISELLDEYGIKTETITSGDNKAMGGMTEPVTKEQKQIFQSLVDDAYDQFVDIVAKGRNLEEEYVRKLADGRIYTARQAQENKLIDKVVETYDDAVEDMQKDCGLYGCDVREFRYVPEYGLFDGFINSMDKLAGAMAGNSDISAISELMESGGNGELPLEYMCEVRK